MKALFTIAAILIFLTLFSFFPHTNLHAQTSNPITVVTSGNLVLTATFTSIGVELKNTTAASGTLEFKKSTETSYRQGLPLWQAEGALYGSALLLQAGTTYDVRITPAGGGAVTASITTRPDNILTAASLVPTYFVRTDGNDANTGTSDSSSGAWKTIYKALTTAPANAIVQIGPGHFVSPGVSNKDFVRASPITLRAQFPALDDNRNEINAGKHTIIEDTVTSPTGTTTPNPGIWQQVTLTGPATGQKFTVWKWTSTFASSYYANAMSYATTYDDTPSRIGYWDRKSGTTTDKSGKVYTTDTPEGWAEVLYTNLNYRYGFTSFGSDIYLRMPNDLNPNTVYLTLTRTPGNGAIGFHFASPNIRLTGLEIRQVGADFETGTSFSVVDHTIFELIGLGFSGSKGTPSSYATDNLAQYNKFIDSSSWSNDPTKNPGITESWCWIKCAITLADGTGTGWSRVGAVNESTAIGGVGKRTVYRYNTIDGFFNGIGEYADGYDRYSMQDNDIYDNLIQHVSDDAFEPEQQGINIRIWNNKLYQTGTGLSTGPLYYGPVFFFRNQIWNWGEGAGKDIDGTTGLGAVGFKYSGSGTTTKAKIYVINNTFWTTSGGDGGNQYAGGGTNTEHFYLRNNIFRAGRYAFAAPANTPGTSDKWDEDYNYFSTSYTADTNHQFNYNSANQKTVALYRTNSGQGQHTNLSDTNGDFRMLPDIWLSDPVNKNFSLTASSPLIDKGVIVPNLTDQVGINYAGSNPDLGAVETGLSGNVTPTTQNTPTPTIILRNGDADGNGTVNINDLKLILQNWLINLPTIIDQYGDGRINAMDFARVLNALPSSPTPTSGPNPTNTPTPPTNTITPTSLPTPTSTGSLIVGSGGFATIQAAVDAAVTGNMIKIKAGTYPEQVQINKTLTLQAYGDGPVWVDGGCSRANGVYITAPNVTVTGFGIKNTTEAGVRIDDTTSKNITVDHMTIQDFNCQRSGPEYKAGIAVWYGGSGMRFTNNTIIHGVALSGGIIPGNSDGIWFKSETGTASGGGHYIAGNTIKGVWDGIGGEKEDDAHGAFDGNTIVENNTIDTCNDDGIQVEGNGQNVHVRYNIISHCSVGLANAPSLIGPVYFEYNKITDGVVGEFGNLACFKIGNSGRPDAGTTYYTGNYCNITGDGWAQSNSGMNPMVARNNSILTGRYIIELSTAPGAGTSFDYDCLYTTDPTRFVKWANSTTGLTTFAGFQSKTGNEVHGTNSQNCPIPTP